MFSSFRGMRPASNVPGLPALDLLISLPFLIGLGITLWRWKRLVFAGCCWPAPSMLAPTVFSEYAPHFRRAVGATPVAALFIGLGLAALLGRPQEKAGKSIHPQRLTQQRLGTRRSPGVDGSAALGARVLVVTSSCRQCDLHGVPISISGAATMPYTMPMIRASGRSGNMSTACRLTSGSTLAAAGDGHDPGFRLAGRPSVRRFDGRHAFVAGGGSQPATFIVIVHEDYRGAARCCATSILTPGRCRLGSPAGRPYAAAFRVENPPGPPPATDAVDARWPGITLVGYDIDKTDLRARREDLSSSSGGVPERRASESGLCSRTCSGRLKADGSIGLGRAGCPTRTGSMPHANLVSRRSDAG